jgi:peptidoglycan/xylan/chitin deacetylase (PgdA/CDA1 family)
VHRIVAEGKELGNHSYTHPEFGRISLKQAVEEISRTQLVIERIGQDLQMPVKLGQIKLPLRKNLSYTATFSSVVGLAQCGYKKSFRYSISSNGHQRWTKQFSNRFRELYEEYF